jgi:Kef-type K+ transport system membrane component KefB
MTDTRVALLAVAFLLVLLPWLLWRVRTVRAFAPLAVVQILSGVMLGPTVFGRVAPEWHAALFGPPVLAALDGLATVGVLLYVLVSGLHLDLGGLRHRARGLSGVALGSFALPFALGIAVGAWVTAAVPGAMGPRGDAASLVAAVAVCIAVTALPVLAAILREMGLIGTRLGQTALALAAVNDAALWLVLAVLLALAAGSVAEVLTTLGLAVLWLGVMVGVVRPLLARLAAGEEAEERMLAAAVATAIASAASAEAIGIGYIIGAFAAGTLMPLRCRAALLARLEPVAATILLPFFFMATGLKALIEPGEPVFLALLALATLATVAGKVVGTALPARAAGEPWSFALALGALMQAKGLMEVVVLAVLHDAGLIGTTLFSAMVAMAMVCTVIAAPLTRLALARGGRGVGAFSVGVGSWQGALPPAPPPWGREAPVRGSASNPH